MPALKQRLAGSNSAVMLLVASAVGAVAVAVVAGVLLHANTKRVISAAEWVEHTQDVLASLQHASLLVERIEDRTRLYRLSGTEDQLILARLSASQLETSTGRLQSLVGDNVNQAENVRSLLSCAAELSKEVDTFTPTAETPEILIQRCQRTIGQMTDQEQWLLKERTLESSHSSTASVGTEFGFVGVSLITLVVLFGLLLRDAVLRQRVGKETALTNERLASMVGALEDRARESVLLTSARDELQLCTDVAQVYESSAKSISRLLEETSGSLCLIDNSRQLVEAVSCWESGGRKSQLEDFHSPESCCGLRSGQPRWRQPGVSEIQCAHFGDNPPAYYLCMPIMAHGNTLGMLYVQCPGVDVVEQVNQRMDGLRQLVQLVGMAVATLNLRTKLENQSIRDSLTGLFNRHFMQISLDRELSRASRRKQVLAVFMLDLDHFKQFNDTHGHAAGDTALRAFANIFRSSIRNDDIACRYGGEEFTIILPDVTPDAACERAEAIRQAVGSLRVPVGEGVYGEFTVSIGMAFYPNDGEAADLLLRRADQALYRAKHLGRNQVALFEAADMAT
jgi:diguanylate cyclase (GGDEF)-like protein